MKKQDENLRELFTAARRADRAEAPRFDELLQRQRPAVRSRTLRYAALATAASITIAVAASWLFLRDSGQQLTLQESSPELTVSEASESAPVMVVQLQEESEEEVAPTPEFETSPPKESSELPSAEVVHGEMVIPEPAPQAELLPAQPMPRQQPARPDSRLMVATGALQSAPPPEAASEAIPTQPTQRRPQQPEAVPAPPAARNSSEERRKEPLPEMTSRGPRSERRRLRDVVADGDVKETPEAGDRFYQNVLRFAPGVQDADGDGNQNVHGSRSRDFKAVVGGVSNASTYPEEAPFSTESYDVIHENDFLAALNNPLSTFSIDVDTASYSNVRRFITQGQMPPKDAVRIEEMINYFHYDYPPPTDGAPFSASVEIAGCPWRPEHRLARIGLKGEEITRAQLAGSNLVFLLDVSGSMQPANKLPLLKSAFSLLVEQLDGSDRVAIVVYAGASGLVLPSTSGSAKGEILEAIDRLDAGGSTNGGSGLKLAYRIARENFIPGGINRVILATDGDFNVGVTGKGALLDLIEKDARRGIFLTTLGFGMGNYKDDTLETLADRGNGNYAYIDSLREARKVLVEELGGTLVTIAKDVKIQVEFNPTFIGAYRLIGYENRMLEKEDFNDDKKDAGEIGAGHTVTALYEIAPPGSEEFVRTVDPLKYQTPPAMAREAQYGELLTLKIRYKEPEGRKSRLLEFPIMDEGLGLKHASEDFKFAAAVAQFGMILRESEHRGSATLEDVRALAMKGIGSDEYGYRSEFYDLVNRSMRLDD